MHADTPDPFDLAGAIADAYSHWRAGNALRRRGRLDEAVACYREAIVRQPDLVAAYGSLAETLADLGELAPALEQASLATLRAPQEGRAYAIAAAIAQRMGEPDRAEAWLRKGLEAAPDDPALLVALARTLRRAGFAADARSLCAHLIGAGIDAWSLQAELDQDEGRYDQAIAAWDRAIECADRPAPAITAKANLLLELGRIDLADTAFGQATTHAPTYGPALFGRASIAGHRRQVPDIPGLEALLAGGGTQAWEDRVHLHFALGRAYLDGDDPDQAFRHFTAGNALRRASYAYDVADDERLLASIAAAFPSELIATAADACEPSERPAFIVGMPRSGTSVLEQMLSAHPLVHGAGELLHVKRLVTRELAALGPFPGVAVDLTAEQRRMLGRHYLDATAARAPTATRIIDKLPLNFYFAGLIHLILPGARIIHIRRDPLDTCMSCYTTLFREPVRYAHDLAELGRFHRAYQRLMGHWRQVLPASRFIEVAYDRLVTDPEPEIRRLVAFCGIAWDAACLRPEASGRPIHTASRLQARQPLYPSSIGRAQRYRDHLGPLIAALDGAD